MLWLLLLPIAAALTAADFPTTVDIAPLVTAADFPASVDLAPLAPLLARPIEEGGLNNHKCEFPGDAVLDSLDDFVGNLSATSGGAAFARARKLSTPGGPASTMVEILPRNPELIFHALFINSHTGDILLAGPAPVTMLRIYLVSSDEDAPALAKMGKLTAHLVEGEFSGRFAPRRLVQKTVSCFTRLREMFSRGFDQGALYARLSAFGGTPWPGIDLIPAWLFQTTESDEWRSLDEIAAAHGGKFGKEGCKRSRFKPVAKRIAFNVVLTTGEEPDYCEPTRRPRYRWSGPPREKVKIFPEMMVGNDGVDAPPCWLGRFPGSMGVLRLPSAPGVTEEDL